MTRLCLGVALDRTLDIEVALVEAVPDDPLDAAIKAIVDVVPPDDVRIVATAVAIVAVAAVGVKGGVSKGRSEDVEPKRERRVKATCGVDGGTGGGGFGD